MNISPDQAEEALADIQKIMQKTRHSIASSSFSTSLMITGIIWLTGFVCTQFLTGEIVVYIWIGMSILGSILASILGSRQSRLVRNPAAGATTKRVLLTWLLLTIYCLAAIVVAWPLDGKQMTIFIVLFVMIGWTIMGLSLLFTPVWPSVILVALVLAGYFFLPDFFYLIIGILGGGGMIALGLIIKYRW